MWPRAIAIRTGSKAVKNLRKVRSVSSLTEEE